MSEWNLMVAMAKANNNQEQAEVARLILENDLTDMRQVTSMAIRSFLITDDNVKQHMESAKKLAALPLPDDALDILVRHDLLKEKVEALDTQST
jgi:hypothetical protein